MAPHAAAAVVSLVTQTLVTATRRPQAAEALAQAGAAAPAAAHVSNKQAPAPWAAAPWAAPAPPACNVAEQAARQEEAPALLQGIGTAAGACAGQAPAGGGGGFSAGTRAGASLCGCDSSPASPGRSWFASLFNESHCQTLDGDLSSSEEELGMHR
jgi:hypothetical protein